MLKVELMVKVEWNLSKNESSNASYETWQAKYSLYVYVHRLISNLFVMSAISFFSSQFC